MSVLDALAPLPLARSGGLVEMPADTYHADPSEQPSLSSSLVKILCSSTPAHARMAHPRLNPFYEAEEEKKFDLGTAAHELLLEGEAAVAVLDFADWRTKAAQEARDAARAKGLTPLLAKDWARVEQMTNAVRRQLDMFDLDPPLLAHGKPERSLFWDDDGVACRARYDWITDDLTVVDDVKTTAASAEPGAWRKTMFGIGGDIQAAFYLRGLRKALGADPVWRFIVVENYPPFAMSVVTLSEDVLGLAAAKVEYAIGVWRECMASGHWPGYSRETSELALPVFEEQRWIDRGES